MSLRLEDQHALLESLPPRAAETLRDVWAEATRAFSAAGIRNYLRGVEALNDLGRTEDLLLAYIEKAPLLARAIGEDSVPRLVEFVLAMASKTSGEVLALLIEKAPAAAARLGDAEVFEQFLDLMAHVAANAPRAMRPLLEHLDPLFAKLTLGGLRRWVQYGLRVYAQDLEGQVSYFSLQSPDALSVLQSERKGTVFVEVQRRLGMYLRAIWGRDFFMRPTSGDYESREGLRPYIERYVIHIADAYDDFRPQGSQAHGAETVSGLDVYRAALNHCAAHLVFTRKPLEGGTLNELQRAVCEVIEDARVESLACGRYPKMRELWRAFFSVPESGSSARYGDLLERLSLALLDREYRDVNDWVDSAAQRFNALSDLEAEDLSLKLGLELAEELSHFEFPPFHPVEDRRWPIYRDDNRFIWEAQEYDVDAALQATWEQKQRRRDVSVMEMVNAVDVEFAGDDAQEIWTLGTEFFLDDGRTINELEGGQRISHPFFYPEWDYQIQLPRPAWATVIERRPPQGDLHEIEQEMDLLRPVITRLKYRIEALVPQGMQRLRHLEDGDELDVDAAVRAMVALRMGDQPDPRVMIRHRLNVRDIAVLVLLDLSESINDPLPGQEGDKTLLALTREACLVLAEALETIGDPYALHGFRSDSRHDVHYLRYKDFDQSLDDTVRARLAGMDGAYSTRLGAALRHAGAYLRALPQQKKLLLAITDGEPADVDVRDPQYLRHDARHAVDELRRSGVVTYGLSLDPYADQYVAQIFGVGHYTVLDHVDRLPEKLSTLYMGLTQ